MTTRIENNNDYEKLVKELIISGINGMTPEMEKLILESLVEKQREMVLTVMEENNPEHRLLCSKIRKVVNANKTGETKHIADVVKMLRQYVEVSDTEVKTMGEVMTPISLVEEMLDTLPYEVWTNPELKWLDPCNGVGTFISVIAKRLMKGLENYEPNAELRYKHIMENMIYTAELQAKNVFLYLYAFDPKDEFGLNVFNGSYLDESFDYHMKKYWGVEKFDIVVMNPPYNTGSNNKGSAHTLWDKFVIKTIDQLIKGGYLLAVHPDGWRNLGNAYSNVKKVLKSKQITYLELHDKKDGMKTFGAFTTYDFYCLHNVPNTMFTKIKCMDGTTQRVDISKMEFIPNGMYNEFEKFVAKDNENVNLLRNCKYHTQKEYVSKEQSKEFQFPCIYYTYKDGSSQLRYSSTNQKGHFGIPKVIFSQGISHPIIDEDGEYGLTEFAFAIIDEPENLPFIQKAMLHPDFIKLMEYADGVSGQRYNRKVIATFRKDFWKEFLY